MYCFNAVQDSTMTALIVVIGSKYNLLFSLCLLFSQAENMTELSTTLIESLEEYNAESKQPMHLVLFSDAMEHVARISRVLRQPQVRTRSLANGSTLLRGKPCYTLIDQKLPLHHT